MTSPVEHTDVGAYAIGALDPADAARFEEHLAWCEHCGAELEQLMGIGPILAEYAQDVPDAAALSPRPSRELLDGMLARVVVTHRQTRRRRLYLVAAAAAAIIAAPVATYMVTGDNAGGGDPVVAAQTLWDQSEHKADHTDKKTGVRASVAMSQRKWGGGTDLHIKLGNVPGPETCKLVVYGKDGTKQTSTTWAVPKGGYDWEDAKFYNGGAGYDMDDIEKFEVETESGEHLVTVQM